MFIRVKESKNSPRKTVQIVASFRKGKSVVQKTIRYVGVASDDQELAMMKQLAETLMVKIENEAKPPLFSPEELNLTQSKAGKDASMVALNADGKAFRVDLRDLVEESRTVEGIHDVYGALFEQMGLGTTFEVRTERSGEIFKEMVLARVASPRSKKGHTLIPCLKELRTKYNVTRAIFVADSGMCNEANLIALQTEGFEYIVGARLKNQSQAIIDQILKPGAYVSISSTEKMQALTHPLGRLIVHHSEDRARKNRFDRRRAVDRLAKKLAKKKTLKASDLLGNYGHKKYLKAIDEGKIELDEDKIQADEKWDGLLGILSNATSLSNVDLLRHYQQLWIIEQAFRIQKHSLAVRPIYHFKKERIQAHIAICFAAFSLMTHLRYRVALQQESMSLDQIREELMTVQASIYFNKTNGLRYALSSHFSDAAKKIYKVLNLSRNLTAKIISN